MTNIFKILLDQGINLVIVFIGIYYIINYKSTSAEALSRSRSIFGKPKYLMVLGPYFFLLVGIILIIVGILSLFHIIKSR